MRAVLGLGTSMYVYFSIRKLERQALSLQLQLQQKNHLSSTAILAYSIPSPNYSPRVIPKIVVNMQSRGNKLLASLIGHSKKGLVVLAGIT